MRGTDGLGEFEQLVLLAILRLDAGAYGVSIREEIARCTGRQVAPGAIYTSLDRLHTKSFVTSWTGEATRERGGRAKRFYAVTDKGKGALRTAQQAFRSMSTGVHFLEETHG